MGTGSWGQDSILSRSWNQRTLQSAKKALLFFLSKSQKDFFVDIDKISLKFIWKGKDNRIAKYNFEKEE